MKSMGIIVVLAAMELLLVLSAPAQTSITFAVGPKIGFNLANASYSPDIPPQSGITKSSRFGFAFGAQAELGIIPYLGIQIEPMYAQKGDKLDGLTVVDQNNQPIGKASETDKLAELDIPILVKAKYPAGVATPYIVVGPSLGITLSSTSSYESPGLTIPDQDMKNTTSSTDFGLVFGAGTSIDVVPQVALSGDVRYQLGLSNMLTNQPAGSNQSVKTNGFQFFFGALFTI